MDLAHGLSVKEWAGRKQRAMVGGSLKCDTDDGLAGQRLLKMEGIGAGGEPEMAKSCLNYQ